MCEETHEGRQWSQTGLERMQAQFDHAILPHEIEDYENLILLETRLNLWICAVSNLLPIPSHPSNWISTK